jgi:hypothetical protein
MKPEDKAVVQQALEVIETPIHEQPFMAKQKAITALRQLLEQPSTEDSSEVDHADELTIAYLDGVHTGKQIAKREWVGLTTEEMEKLSVENGKATFLNDDEETDILWFDGDCFALLRAAEAKLKEKNT